VKRTDLVRTLAVIVIAGHGLIHLIGFVVPWRIAVLEGFAYRTTALNGMISLGETGAQVVGIAWLVISAGFLVAAVGVWRHEPWAMSLTAVLAVCSLVVCVLGLPETGAGIVVNGVILAVIGYLTLARSRRSVVAAS